MRILDTPPTVIVTGAAGQLGGELCKSLRARSFTVIGFDRSQLTITDFDAIEKAVLTYKPQLIINTAAFTTVDLAETESVAAEQSNHLGAAILAQVCAKHAIPLIHYSTDYVFDGMTKQPYKESDTAHPLNEYGKSKLRGELAIQKTCEKYIILRVSWLFSRHGRNFVRTVCRISQNKKNMHVVNDQIGCPTAIDNLVLVTDKIVDRIVASDDIPWGLYHYCDAPSASWFMFANEIVECGWRFKKIAEDFLVEPISSSDFGAPAPRPHSVVLDCSKIYRAFGVESRDWRQSLAPVVEAFFLDEQIEGACDS